MNEVEFILQRKSEFLKFLKSKFTLIHLSNFFFRDFHYGVMTFLSDHGKKLRYQEAEKIAVEVGRRFEEEGIFKRVDFQSWKLHYPEFALPKVEKPAAKPAAPAAAAAAAPKPA